MKYPTVSALCEGVAGAIRKVEGSSALINPQDFPDRIKGLEVGGGGGSKMRYLKRTGWLPSAGGGDITTYSAMSQVVRYEDSRWSDDGSVKAMIDTGSQTLVGNNIYPIAFGFDPNTIVFNPRFNAEKTTLWKRLANVVYEPVPPEYADEYSDYIYPEYFEEITEEQFYDTTTFLTPQEITFTVKHEMNPVEYTALDGMTWEEFCNSDYNSGGDWGSGTVFFEVAGGKIYLSSSGMGLDNLVLNDNTFVKPTDTIINGGAYKMNGLQ